MIITRDVRGFGFLTRKERPNLLSPFLRPEIMLKYNEVLTLAGSLKDEIDGSESPHSRHMDGFGINTVTVRKLLILIKATAYFITKRAKLSSACTPTSYMIAKIFLRAQKAVFADGCTDVGQKLILFEHTSFRYEYCKVICLHRLSSCLRLLNSMPRYKKRDWKALYEEFHK